MNVLPQAGALWPRSPLVVGRWTVDLDRRQLRRGRRKVTLEPIALRLLVVLVDRRGRLTSSEELRRRVWEGRHIDSRTIAKRISELRRALGDRADSPRYIATIPRKGYVLIAPVRRGEGTRRRRIVGAVALLVGSALLVVTVNRVSSAGTARQLAERAAAALAMPSRSRPSPSTVAVLHQAVATTTVGTEARVALVEAYARGALSSGPRAEWRSLARQEAAALTVEVGSPSVDRALGLAAAASFRVSEALAAQERAVRQDGSDSEASYLLAEALSHRGRWLDALAILLRVSDRDPAAGWVAYEISHLYRSLGLNAAADAWFRHGERLRPHSIRGQVQRATFDLSAGRFPEAQSRMMPLLDVNPACVPCLQILGEVELREGRPLGAEALLRLVAREAPDPARAFARLRLATLEPDREALLVALADDWESGLSPGDDSWFGPWLMARLHAASGRLEEALGEQQLAVERGYRYWRMDETEPLFAILRGNARFRSTVRQQRDELSRMAARALQSGLIREPERPSPF